MAKKERGARTTPERKCKISFVSEDGGGRAMQGAGGKGEPERTKCAHLKTEQAIWPWVGMLGFSLSLQPTIIKSKILAQPP